MKSLKIGLFVDTFFPMVDGVTMVVDQYARNMSGYSDVTVFAPKTGEYDFSQLPYRVVTCKSIPIPFSDYRLPLPALDRKFKKLLEKSELDIVHIHSPFTVSKAGVKYAKRHAIPSVATLHSQYKMDFERNLKFKPLVNIGVKTVVKCLDSVDVRWTVNSLVRSLYKFEYGGKNDIELVHNATDLLPVPDAASARQKINARFSISDNSFLLLFVGRIDRLKNIVMMANSAALLKQKNVDFKLLFVGSGNDEQLLDSEIARLGIGDRVIRCGRIYDRTLIAEIYSRADIFLFPSMYDTSSLVQIEAASQKTPVLFLEGAMTGAGIRDGVDGYISSPSAEGIAQRIFDAVSDREKLSSVSQCAYNTLYRNWADASREIYCRYLEICGK